MLHRRSESFFFAGILCCLAASRAHATTLCEVTFAVDATEAVTTVDIAADYSSAVGTFEGADLGAHCKPLVADTVLFARDTCTSPDNYCYFGANRALYLIASNAAGFEGDAEILSCSFVSPQGRAPTAQDFSVSVRSANTLATGDASTTVPTVRIADILCAD